MSRAWVDDAKKKPIDKRWVMRCDVGFWDAKTERCQTVSEPQWGQPDLWWFVAEGWFVSKHFDDICPACLADGITSKQEPHPLMARGSLIPTTY